MMTRERRRSPLLIAPALLLLAATLSGPVDAQDGPLEVFLVPVGGTVSVAGEVDAALIRIDGDLMHMGPDDLVLRADRIEIGPGARVLAGDGTPGYSRAGIVAMAEDGRPGASIKVHADEVVIGAGAALIAGSGGGGGSASASVVAVAGGGGEGGSIFIEAATTTINGSLVPGAGGDGGDAWVAGGSGGLVGRAVAGDGGDSGTVMVGGEPFWRPVEVSLAPETAAARLPEVDVCDPQVMASGLALISSLASEVLDCHGDGSAPGRAVEDLIRSCGLSTQAALPVPPDPSACRALLELIMSLPDGVPSVVDKDECTVDPPADVNMGPGPLQMASPGICKETIAFLLQSALDSVVLPGTPGQSGGSGFGCMEPKGSDGEPNIRGDGGDGGNACVDNQGREGSNGSHGEDGALSCGNGGPGGNGGNGFAATATGGNGGIGLQNGGDGGDAIAIAKGGAGGDGGNGGEAWFYKCAGGNGGNGGNGADATATAGNGGTGLCGHGGEAGAVAVMAAGGEGGSGGSGVPGGTSGVPGLPGSAQGTGGQGGAGADVCPTVL